MEYCCLQMKFNCFCCCLLMTRFYCQTHPYNQINVLMMYADFYNIEVNLEKKLLSSEKLDIWR